MVRMPQTSAQSDVGSVILRVVKNTQVTDPTALLHLNNSHEGGKKWVDTEEVFVEK